MRCQSKLLTLILLVGATLLPFGGAKGHSMNMNLTEIVVVLDRSGSMVGVASDVRGGFDEFVQKQQDAPGEAHLTLVQFDTQYETVYAHQPLADVPKLQLEPRGMTALLDAMGRTINETEKRLNEIPESYRPGRVIFVTITDGYENSSREFLKPQINDMILKRNDLWQFVFIGANQDAIAEGGGYGVNMGGSLTYENTSGSINQMFNSLSTSSTILRNSGDATSSNFFTPEQRTTQDESNTPNEE